MNAPAVSKIVTPDIGTRTEDGTFFGTIRTPAGIALLYQPPMALALQKPDCWNQSLERVAGAYSFCDGEANTIAMAKAGSRVAQFALDHGLIIPALDQSDLQYRAFKPTAQPNWCYLRSGINLNAETPLEPYTPEFPAQTALADYREGGPEAFPAKALWTSTHSRGWDASAWVQFFGGGNQFTGRKSIKLPVVLVRSKIIR